MARFYGSLRGSSGEVTRQGDAESGIYGHLRGWNVGAKVSCFLRNGKDHVAIHLTGGSNNIKGEQHLLAMREDEEIESISPSQPGLINGERQITIRIRTVKRS